MGFVVFSMENKKIYFLICKIKLILSNLLRNYFNFFKIFNIIQLLIERKAINYKESKTELYSIAYDKNYTNQGFGDN